MNKKSKHQKIVYRIVSIILLPAFLLTNTIYADTIPAKTDMLAVPSVVQAISRCEKELDLIASAPAGKKPLKSDLAEIYGDRAMSIRDAWVSKTAELTAQKLIKIIREDLKIELSSRTEGMLIKNLKRDTENRGMNPRRTKMLLNAVRLEFAKFRAPAAAESVRLSASGEEKQEGRVVTYRGGKYYFGDRLLEDVIMDEGEDVKVREAAIREIGNINATAFIPQLLVLDKMYFKKSAYDDICGAAFRAMEIMYGPNAVEAFINALRNKNLDIRRWVPTYILGLIEDPRAVEFLIELLKDEDVDVRIHAANSLGNIGDVDAVDTLIEALKDEDANVRSKAAEALGKIGDQRAVGPLIELLEDKNTDVCSAAASSLGDIGGPRAIEALIKARESKHADVRRIVPSALGKTDDPRAIEILIEDLESNKDAEIRYDAASILGHMREGRALEPLIEALNDEDPIVRIGAVNSLGRIPDPSARALEPVIEALRKALRNKERSFCIDAIKVLAEKGDSRAAEVLIEALGYEDRAVHSIAAYTLAYLHDFRVLETLIEDFRAYGPDDLRLRMAFALGEMGKEGNPRAFDVLIEATRDGDWQAAFSLGMKGDIRVVEFLIRALKQDNYPRLHPYVITSLGRIGGPRAAEALSEVLEKDEDANVRRDAANALSCTGDPRAREHLIKALKRDKSSNVREWIALALGRLGASDAVEPLIEALDDKDPYLRKNASEALGQLANPMAVIALIKMLKDKYLFVRLAAAEALGKIQDPRAVGPLNEALLKDDSRLVREAAARALGQIRDSGAVESSIAALRDTQWRVRQDAAWALGQIADPRAEEPLMAALKDESCYVRQDAARALGEIAGPRAIDALIETLKNDKDADVRIVAIRSFGKIGGARVVVPLTEVLEDKDPHIRQVAAQALCMIDDPRAAKALTGIIPTKELPYATEAVITPPEDFSKTASQKVADKIRQLQEDPKKVVTIVLATGNTMVEFLRILASEEDIDWKRIQAFHLDEYKGLPPDHPSSFAAFLRENLFDRVSALPMENIHYINGANADLKTYMRKLEEFGGADIVILGVGMDGHLAFNEPPRYSRFDSRMQEVKLEESTLEANKLDYPEIRENPYAYTMGMNDIYKGRHLFFFANGARKAEIVQRSLKGPITEDVPASMLQMHPNVTVVLDTAAASRLKAVFNLEMGGYLVPDPYGEGKIILERLVAGKGLAESYTRLLEKRGQRSTLAEVNSQNIVNRAKTAFDKKTSERDEEDVACFDVVLNSMESLAKAVVETIGQTRVIAQAAGQKEEEPVRIVLVGGVAEGGGEFYWKRLQEKIDEFSKDGKKIEIIRTTMGDEREIIGAVEYPGFVLGASIPDKKYAIGVDLGGTNIRVGRVNLDTMQIEGRIEKCPALPEGTTSLMEELRKKLQSNSQGMDAGNLPEGLRHFLTDGEERGVHRTLTDVLLQRIELLIRRFDLTDVGYVSIALPGIFEEKGPVKLAYNVPTTGVDVRKELGERLSLPDQIYAGNDVASGGVGEITAGAGKEFTVIYVLNVGTGLTMCLVHKDINDARSSASGAGIEPKIGNPDMGGKVVYPARASASGSQVLTASQAASEIEGLMNEVVVHSAVKYNGNIPLTGIAIVMKKNLPEVATGSKAGAVAEALKQGYGSDRGNGTRYPGMRKEIRDLFTGDEKGLYEVDDQTALISKVSELRGKGIRVVILDDGSLQADKLGEDVISQWGKPGEDYCAISLEKIKELADSEIPFVNINAMAMMGVGVLYNDVFLFQTYYKIFTGEEAPANLIGQITTRTLWIIKAIPRIVKLSIEEFKAREELRKLFAVAA